MVKIIAEFCQNHNGDESILDEMIHLPRLVEFRSELPKTNVGKILRRALKEQELIKSNQ